MKNARIPSAAIVLALCLIPASARGQSPKANRALMALIPQVKEWKPSEALHSFFPDTLFEYIDGAAESYLSYDFKELLVVQLGRTGTEATMTVEIYDMGLPLNAFGIFSAERYPENRPVPVGDLGYIDGEALNFVAGRYYMKLLSYNLKERAEALLTEYARKIAAAIPEKGGLPTIFRVFPREDMVPRSEKFIEKNVLGFEFLRRGYLATYKVEGQEMDAVIVEAGSEQEAEGMLADLLGFYTKDNASAEKTASGIHLKNRYSQHLFLGRVRNLVCGVIKVPAGLEASGQRIFAALRDSAAGLQSAGS